MRVGKHELTFETDDKYLHAGDRREEHVVRRVHHLVGADADVVERHRLEVGPRFDHLAGERGANERREADRGEFKRQFAAGRAVAVRIELRTIGGRENRRAVDMHRDLRSRLASAA